MTNNQQNNINESDSRVLNGVAVDIFSELILLFSAFGISLEELSRFLYLGAAIASTNNNLPEYISGGISEEDYRKAKEFSGVNKRLTKAKRDALTSILEVWHTRPEFTTAYAGPKQLPLEKNSPEDLTFSDLVSLSVEEITAGEALEILQAQKKVEVVNNKTVMALTRYFVSATDYESKASEASLLISRAIKTALWNFNSKSSESMRCNLYAYSISGVPDLVAEQFTKYCRDKSHDFLAGIDNYITSYENQQDSSKKIGLNVFQFVDD